MIQINNGQYLEVKQEIDEKVTINKYNSQGQITEVEIINPCDFVTMLNWYRYQKENGNKDLMF